MEEDFDYAIFPGRPWRRGPQPYQADRRWSDWRSHECAPMVEEMLDERGLDDRDVLMVESGRSLAIETAEDVRFLADDDDAEEQAQELEALARDLDRVVAWVLRDRMISAASAADGRAGGLWVPDPPRRVGEMARPSWMSGNLDIFIPDWSITASTALVAHLAREGFTMDEALDALCVVVPLDAMGRAWYPVAGVELTLEGGRLHFRSRGPDGFIADRDGFDLIVPGMALPEASMGLAGRRLFEVVQLTRPPSVLAGMDPIIVAVAEYDDPWSGQEPGIRIRLDVGTETLADVPASALAAIGLTGRSVPRGEKPWLDVGLRADGAPRS